MDISKKDRIALVITILLIVFGVISEEFIFVVLSLFSFIGEYGLLKITSLLLTLIDETGLKKCLTHWLMNWLSWLILDKQVLLLKMSFYSVKVSC
ncbi:hypothetical protein E9Q_03088 [Moraxella catarrhalis BC1]|nr:hypothetical protein E9Q_03088 [Moraxella catarrhalis BC1]